MTNSELKAVKQYAKKNDLEILDVESLVSCGLHCYVKLARCNKEKTIVFAVPTQWARESRGDELIMSIVETEETIKIKAEDALKFIKC